MEYTYEKYIKDVETGRVKTGNSIKKAVERFKEFRKRSDIVFDEAPVRKCIEFIGTLRHFLGKSAGMQFILEPWQQFIIANILGLKWKHSGLRVCREVYIQIARKAGKDALIAAICLYLMIAEGEASPEIVAAANSTDQAKILFTYVSKFAAQLDPSKKTLKQLRSSVQCIPNDGNLKVISSDASKADGLNLSTFVLDEYHEARDRKMYDVLQSSMGQRTQPLAVIITTAGFSLDGPCHDMYELAIQILNGIKEMDNFFPFIWELDPDDDWKDPSNFIKCQPNLGVTVTKEFMLGEVNKAQVDSTAVTGVLTKILNKWVQSKVTWLSQELIAQLMTQNINLEDHRGKTIILALDLGSVGDFSSMTALIPPDETTDNKYLFKTWTFLPEATLNNHPNQRLYEKFIDEGCMIITPGNVQDYDFILNKIWEISQVCSISGVYLDKWNATQFQIDATNAGYNVQEFSQSVGHYNGCVKEFERLAKENKIVLDKSSCVLWQFGNVFLKGDINGNVKPSKESASKKIDSVISITTALGGYMENPIDNSLEIFVL